MMNISKEDFVDMVDRLMIYTTERSLLHRTICVLNHSETDFNFKSADMLMYAVIHFLTKLTSSDPDVQYDKEIQYFVFEVKPKRVTVDNKEFFLNTPEDLYDYLEYKNSH